jgi:phosphatidylethanolamine/phosphatidyl-N-methylethanolamine N-methyltransferase
MIATQRADSIRHKVHDVWLFLSRWAKAPGRVGAIAPSSRALALAMARQIPGPVEDDGPVIELGGGTGSITVGLLDSGIAPQRLIVIERDPQLAALLRRRFQGVTVICGDAGHLPELLAGRGITKVAAVVSGLPLLLFPDDLLARIVDGCRAVLGEDRPLIQFTYGRGSPLSDTKFALSGTRAAQVWLNIPPATVWVYTRREEVA